MRLRILLAKVNPEAITVPTQCAYAGCAGRKVHLRKARDEIPARYGVSASAGALLSVFEVQTPLSGLSAIRRRERKPRSGSKGWR